jgi:hypothetical protein
VPRVIGKRLHVSVGFFLGSEGDCEAFRSRKNWTYGTFGEVVRTGDLLDF